ncbi:iron-containing alcohol dehydrogenase [Actibacterium lipolyticum]|uniref:1,3-propanediol dehydrogenase n=1 Tax=Actibacterium lipolyticum TaxID=1524263 RepID=A0A238KPW3_9RHOB|nr:iron-containing alcohol dehydrogenase [Actibacterium lipolyticum]SMX44671.1 1,3-propanediol dehydrogenase [Actibacterium lipolyticum]
MTHPAFSFLTAQEIRFGRGTAGEAAKRLAGMAGRVLLVHGASGARAAWLRDALVAEGVSVTSFACASEPDMALIEAGVSAAKEAAVGAVVSLGGGAVIDAGKAIAALAPATRPMLDHLEVVGKGMPLEAAPLPFVAMPTTSGTGAEVTKNAVIGVPEVRRKVSLRDNRMLPDLAIVDPALTDGCPRAITLASGLDAVTQVIEPYVSTKANRLTDALCRDAIPQGLRALRKLMEAEDPTARDDLSWVSLCGGLALANSGLGAVHGLAGVIGGMAPAAHGAVCGVLLPHVLSANTARAHGQSAERLAEVTAWIGAAFDADMADAVAVLADWSAQAGLPSLGQMGVQRADLRAIAEASGASSSMKGNPVALSAEELTVILQAAF